MPLDDASDNKANGSAHSSTADEHNPRPHSAATDPPSAHHAASSPSSSILRIPEPLKRLFNRFPLLTYPSNALPLRSPHDRARHALYIFTTPSDAQLSAPSFNPTCLKWQTLLLIHGVSFRTVPSTNHASPTGALPFLLPALSSFADPNTTTSPQPIPSHRLTAWATTTSSPPPPQPSSPPSTRPSSAGTHTDPLLTPALLTHTLRQAYLHALYLDPPTFLALTAPLYIHPSTSSPAVRAAQSYTLRAAAHAELLASALPLGASPSSTLDASHLLSSALAALAALTTLLAGREWFADGDDDGPGALDAEVFAYAHALLCVFARPEVDAASPAGRLARGARRCGALVAHWERMVGRFYGEWWRQQQRQGQGGVGAG